MSGQFVILSFRLMPLPHDFVGTFASFALPS